jgi:uncharacterized protein (DUF433 family)
MAEEAHGGNPPAEIIQVDPLVLQGRPFVRGTRLSVDFLQGLLAIGWTREKILGVYTYLSPEELERALSHKAL